MSETLTHSTTLAQRFCEDHQPQFGEAFNATAVEDKRFLLTVEAFDQWLIKQGMLDKPASAFGSATVERRGVTLLRNQIRQQMNVVSIQSERFPAYQINPAKNGMLRVRLVTLYAHEAPDEISGRIRISTRHYHRVIQRAIKILNKSEHVRVEDRAAMVAFSRFMSPMLDAFAAGMVSAIKGAERTKRRYERKRQQ